MNKGKVKVPHSPQDVAEIASAIRQIADRIQEFSDKMQDGTLPAFDFTKKTPMNKFVRGLEDWVDDLDSEWKKQVRAYEKSKRDAELIAAGEAKRGRPPKKRPA